MSEYKLFKAEEMDHIDPQNGIIIDVRTPMEHAEKHLSKGHMLMPLDELSPKDSIAGKGLSKGSSVYLLCRNDNRSRKAAERFTKEGFNDVYVIEGGLAACESHGHEVEGYDTRCAVAGSRPISLERQIRIVAGLLAAIGALLGLVVSPVFSIIPLFVGCGLVFAGVTDLCGMALILTKAPWNKRAGA